MQHDVADRSRRAERSRSSLALARRLLKAKIPVRVCVCACVRLCTWRICARFAAACLGILIFGACARARSLADKQYQITPTSRTFGSLNFARAPARRRERADARTHIIQIGPGSWLRAHHSRCRRCRRRRCANDYRLCVHAVRWTVCSRTATTGW